MTGVEYLSVANPSGEGFVVCLIPESAHKPHRAEFADKHYYIRAGDDFLIAEPGLLRTLFYPRNRPKMAAVAVLTSKGSVEVEEGAITFELVVGIIIRNISDYSATNVCVVVEHDQTDEPESESGMGWEFIGLRPQQAFLPHSKSSMHAIAFASERPLPPGFDSLAGNLNWKRLKAHEHLFSFKDSDPPPCIQDKLAIALSVYGDGIRRAKCNVEFTGDDLRFTGELVAKHFAVLPEE